MFSKTATRHIVEELAVTPNEDCAGLVTVLRAGHRIVAISANLTCPGVLSGWLTGYDHDMAKFSPGKLAMLATAEEAARETSHGSSSVLAKTPIRAG